MAQSGNRRDAPGRRGEARPSAVLLFLIGLAPMVFLALVPVGLLDDFERALYDQRMILRNTVAPRPIPPNVRIIGVGVADEERLDEDLQSRLVYTNMLGVLRRWNVHTVGFDLFFDSTRDHDPFLAHSMALGWPRSILATSFRPVGLGLEPLGDMPRDLEDAANVARSGADLGEIIDWIRDLDEFEEELREWAESLRFDTSMGADHPELRGALGQLAWVRHLRQGLQRRWFAVAHGVDFEPNPDASPFVAADVRLLSPELAFAAHGIGFANVEKGEERVVRHAPLVYKYEGRLFPHLALAMALSWYDVPFDDVEVEWGRELRFTPNANHPGGTDIRIPIDHEGKYLVNFREGEEYLNRHPTIAAVTLDDFREVLMGEEDDIRGDWESSLVLVGEVISGGVATDLEPIPLASQYPMVGLHANILANILEGDFLRVPGRESVVLIHLGLGFIATLFFLFLSFKKAALLVVFLGVGSAILQFFLFVTMNLVLPTVTPLMGLSVGILGFFYYLVLVKDRDRRLVRDVFLKSVSPRVGEEILRNYHDEAIWGAQREISVLFIDIRGYTTLSEEKGPAVVLEVLERFYETVSEAVFRHDGQVNKFLGDAVLAIFGALPEEPPAHAERATRAAIEIQHTILALNQSPWGQEVGVELNTGAGVHTGMATVGLVGRREVRIEYTALGDAVNVASRLQNLAAHGEVIISRETLEQLPFNVAEFLQSLGAKAGPDEIQQVKGRQQPVMIRKVSLNKEKT